MIFWITLVLLIAVLGFSVWKNGNDFFEMSLAELMVIFILVISLIAETIMIGVGHMGVEAQVLKNKERHKAIIYKIENGIYEDDFGILTPNGIREVQEWNEDVVFYQSIQDDFWVGIFFPNVYDQFETIDYTKYNLNDGGN